MRGEEGHKTGLNSHGRFFVFFFAVVKEQQLLEEGRGLHQEEHLLGLGDLSKESRTLGLVESGALNSRNGLVNSLDVGESMLALNLRQELSTVKLLHLNVS
jgi:hypothetical protein